MATLPLSVAFRALEDVLTRQRCDELVIQPILLRLWWRLGYGAGDTPLGFLLAVHGERGQRECPWFAGSGVLRRVTGQRVARKQRVVGLP